MAIETRHVALATLQRFLKESYPLWQEAPGKLKLRLFEHYKSPANWGNYSELRRAGSLSVVNG